MEKKFIKDCIDLPGETFEGSLEKVIENLKNEISKLKETGCKDFVFEWYFDYNYQTVQLHYYRIETNTEFHRREKKILSKMKKEKGEIEKRKKLYLELKKEFEK